MGLKEKNKRWDQMLGRVGMVLSRKILKRVTYEGKDNVATINKQLSEGGSVLLASDHPGTLETVFTAGAILEIDGYQEAGIIVRDGFVNGKSMAGRMAAKVLDEHRVKTLVVKTPKYERDEERMVRFNQATVRECFEMLSKPGRLLLLYATGTRSQSLGEAEEGLGRFSARADLVVPMTTLVEKSKARARVVVNKPIAGKEGVKWNVKQFGKEEGRQTFSDLVMTEIAGSQKAGKRRGIYEETVREIEGGEGEIKGKRSDQLTEVRKRRVKEARQAWKKGLF